MMRNCAIGNESESETSRHKKRTNSRWPSFSCELDPILAAPGGWGLRNPEPKGPGQRTQDFSQCGAAGARRKRGDTMFPANDSVTCRQGHAPRLQRHWFSPDFCRLEPFTNLLRWGMVGAIMRLS